MNFRIVPESANLKSETTRTLNRALGKKYKMLAEYGMLSTIQDSDGYIVSAKEQAQYLSSLLLGYGS